MTTTHPPTCMCHPCRNRRYRARKRLGLVAPPARPVTTVLAEVIIARAPTLPGALCVDRWSLFDAREGDDDRTVTEQLHVEARALCARCPELTPCTTWVESLPPQESPSGVVAGRLYEKNAHPREDHPDE